MTILPVHLTVKRWLPFLLKIVIGLLILPIAGVFSVVVCPLIFPSLSFTVHEPQMEGFCGRYIPMGGTARFLSAHYPGAHPWLDFNRDGTFVFNMIPSNKGSEDDGPAVTEHGKWEIRKCRFCTVGLTFVSGSGNCQSWLHIKGQKSPYLIEYWNDKYLFPMEFCTNPQQSSAVRSYMLLSITDWVFHGLIAVSVLVLPFFLRPESRSSAIGYPFMIILLWGTWHMAYYDPTTSNDIPGMGYSVLAFCYPVLAGILFAIRCVLLQWKSMPQSISPSAEISKRNRSWYLLAVVATIVLGLASRHFPHLFPARLGKYPGDALWALMAFFGWGQYFPRLRPVASRCSL